MTWQRTFGTGAATFTALAALGLAAGTASANLVTNGDFSANASSYGGYVGYSAGFTPTNPSAPTGWSITPNYPIGVNGPDTGFYAGHGSPFAPGSASGVRDFAFLQDWADWNGTVYSNSTIDQVISTTAGQVYTLSYLAAQGGGDTSATMEALVLDAANGNAPIISQAPSINASGFTTNILTFTAVSASTEIAFENTTSGAKPADNTVDVSNVIVDAVPQPASIGLVGFGSLGVGLLLLRRNRPRVSAV